MKKKQGKKLNRTKSLLTSFARCVTLAYLIFWYVSVILIVDYIGSITSLFRNKKLILDKIVKNPNLLEMKNEKKAIWGTIISILNILANFEAFH